MAAPRCGQVSVRPCWCRLSTHTAPGRLRQGVGRGKTFPSHAAFPEHGRKGVGRQRAAAKVALVRVAAFLSQKRQLPLGFHPFRQYRQAHAVPHGDDGRADGAIVLAVRNVVDEPLVDLEHVDGKALELGKRRISGAKVIHRNAQPQGTQAHQHLPRLVGALRQRAFGDFQLQQMRREA